MRLSELKPGETGIIVKILGHGAFRKRMLEMGFVRGREIKVLLDAPLHDPVKYEIMDYEVSLRRSEAELVEVITEKDTSDISDATLVNHTETVRENDIQATRTAGKPPSSTSLQVPASTSGITAVSQ